MTLNVDNNDENNLKIIQQEYKILAEYKMIINEKIAGVYVIPSQKSSFLWFGVLFVRDGPYMDAIFRFNIHLSHNFPDDQKTPSIVFQNDVFHPLICPKTGSLNVEECFPTWTPPDSHLWQLLKFVQFIFYNPTVCTDPGNHLNKEAADMCQENFPEYLQRIKECVRQSRDIIYNDPPTDDKHYIKFDYYDAKIHGPVMDAVKSMKFDEIIKPTQAIGLSWVQEGDFRPLSKPE